MSDHIENTSQPPIENSGKFQFFYDSLISVLKGEIEVYKELHASFLSEQDILLRSSFDELHENNSKKEAIILKANLLNEERMKLVGKIAKFINVDEDEICLSTLVSYDDGRRKKELKERQSALRSLWMNIKEMNEKNKMLLESSLLYVQKSINFISDISELVSPRSTYMETGRLKTNDMNGNIVSWEG